MFKVVATGHIRGTGEPYVVAELTHDRGGLRWGQTFAPADCPDRKVTVVRSSGGAHDMTSDKYRIKLVIHAVPFALEELEGRLLFAETTVENVGASSKEVLEMLDNARRPLDE